MPKQFTDGAFEAGRLIMSGELDARVRYFAEYQKNILPMSAIANTGGTYTSTLPNQFTQGGTVNGLIVDQNATVGQINLRFIMTDAIELDEHDFTSPLPDGKNGCSPMDYSCLTAQEKFMTLDKMFRQGFTIAQCEVSHVDPTLVNQWFNRLVDAYNLTIQKHFIAKLKSASTEQPVEDGDSIRETIEKAVLELVKMGVPRNRVLILAGAQTVSDLRSLNINAVDYTVAGSLANVWGAEALYDMSGVLEPDDLYVYAHDFACFGVICNYPPEIANGGELYPYNVLMRTSLIYGAKMFPLQNGKIPYLKIVK